MIVVHYLPTLGDQHIKNHFDKILQYKKITLEQSIRTNCLNSEAMSSKMATFQVNVMHQ